MRDSFMSGFCVGMALTLFFTISILFLTAKKSKFYLRGVSDTHKEAFEMGLMTKEITKDDKVVYKWKELHKIGYE